MAETTPEQNAHAASVSFTQLRLDASSRSAASSGLSLSVSRTGTVNPCINQGAHYYFPQSSVSFHYFSPTSECAVYQAGDICTGLSGNQECVECTVQTVVCEAGKRKHEPGDKKRFEVSNRKTGRCHRGICLLPMDLARLATPENRGPLGFPGHLGGFCADVMVVGKDDGKTRGYVSPHAQDEIRNDCETREEDSSCQLPPHAVWFMADPSSLQPAHLLRRKYLSESINL